MTGGLDCTLDSPLADAPNSTVRVLGVDENMINTKTPQVQKITGVFFSLLLLTHISIFMYISFVIII